MDNETPTSRDQLGVLFSLKNILKWTGASFPGASSGVEMANQLEGYGMRKRIDSIAEEMKGLKELSDAEARGKSVAPPVSDWSIPAAEFNRRTIDLAVAYDGRVDEDRAFGDERVLHVAHACLIGQNEIVAANESIKMAQGVAEHKRGRVVVLAGLAWHELEKESPVEAVGLTTWKLRQRDEERWKVMLNIMGSHGIREEPGKLAGTPVKFSVSASPGQEVAFLHSGEAEDIIFSQDAFSRRQFDAATISHIKKPSRESLLSCVTEALPGRIVRAGSPAFTREGILVGLIADTESLPSDAGRRAVIRGLADHPRFTTCTPE